MIRKKKPTAYRNILALFIAVGLTLMWSGAALMAAGFQKPHEIEIPMRDGKHLAADLYLPDTGHR